MSDAEARGERFLRLGADHLQEQVERQCADPRWGGVGLGDARLRRNQVATAAQPWVPLVQGLDPGARVVGRQADLEGQRMVRVIEDQVDLVLALAPVVRPSTGDGERSPVT